MKHPALGLLLLLSVPAWSKPKPKATPTAVPAAMAVSPRIWMEGDRVLVSGSAMGYATEEEARQNAFKDAADTAATFLEKRGLGPSVEIRRGVEQAMQRDTKLQSFTLGEVKVENTYQERWNGENNTDRYAIYVTLSIRLKGDKEK